MISLIYLAVGLGLLLFGVVGFLQARYIILKRVAAIIALGGGYLVMQALK
jgi:hypothetical protein